MKTKLISLVCMVSTFSLTALGGFYARAGVMYAEIDDITISGDLETTKSSIEDSAGLNAAIGFKFSALRLEAEIVRLSSDIGAFDYSDIIAAGDYSRTSFFANVLFEIPFTPLIEPYIGGGIGVTNVSVDVVDLVSGEGISDSLTTSADGDQFSYQLMVGIRFSLLDTVSVYGGYRYLSIDSLSFSDNSVSFDAGNGKHVFEIGAGIGF